jgi:hypothetical protein
MKAPYLSEVLVALLRQRQPPFTITESARLDSCDRDAFYERGRICFYTVHAKTEICLGCKRTRKRSHFCSDPSSDRSALARHSRRSVCLRCRQAVLRRSWMQSFQPRARGMCVPFPRFSFIYVGIRESAYFTLVCVVSFYRCGRCREFGDSRRSKNRYAAI